MLNLINCPSMPDFKKVKHVKTPTGSRKKKIYKYVYDEKYGCPRRVVSGEIDIFAYIQEAANDVDFKALGAMLVDARNNVLSHFEIEGETLDITGLPRNIQEYESLYNKMNDEFNKLPAELKALFGNDIAHFRSCWMNGSIANILDAYYKSVTSQVTPSEVNKDVKE